MQARRSIRPLESRGSALIVSITRGLDQTGSERARCPRSSAIRNGAVLSIKTPSAGPVGVASGTTAVSITLG